MKNLIVPLFATLLVLAGCASSDNGSGTEATETAAAPQGDAEPLARDVKFGETAGVSHNDSEFAVTVGAPADYTDFVVPPEEGKYVAIEVEAELLDGVGGAVSAASFTLTDGAGTDYTFAAPNGTDTKEQLFATLLSAGDSESGIVVFDIPVNAGNVVVKFIPVTETEAFASWAV
jgi:hypothetical protein